MLDTPVAKSKVRIIGTELTRYRSSLPSSVMRDRNGKQTSGKCWGLEGAERGSGIGSPSPHDFSTLFNLCSLKTECCVLS